ncbi:DUF1330 domain-containing protein [Streptomyces sp. V4I2]|uniref:DUF1330 domain-containing protein n=1 Tax=unclassified Streptomyces TaxID=2593676 RepID=UPI00277DC7F1|nr:DUF1330 domain-containing protein [Streptomyces sp. V4I2]MDQ1043017.1 uncharacterized protein (DUF1330 family) [Streptomyces sp. V4I2]
MPAFIVIDIDVTDPAGFQQYVAGIVPLMERAGARRVLAAGDAVALEGDWKPSILVVLEFPSEAAVQEFWDSEEYQPLKELRRKSSTVAGIAALQSLPES